MGSCNNPLKIAYGNGIFACWPMFSYGQRSKCADLLNSYGFVLYYKFTLCFSSDCTSFKIFINLSFSPRFRTATR